MNERRVFAALMAVSGLVALVGSVLPWEYVSVASGSAVERGDFLVTMVALAVLVLACCMWWVDDRDLLRVATILAAVGLAFSLNQTIIIAANVAQLSDDGAASSQARTGVGLGATLIGLGLATLLGILARFARDERPARARAPRTRVSALTPQPARRT